MNSSFANLLFLLLTMTVAVATAFPFRFRATQGNRFADAKAHPETINAANYPARYPARAYGNRPFGTRGSPHYNMQTRYAVPSYSRAHVNPMARLLHAPSRGPQSPYVLHVQADNAFVAFHNGAEIGARDDKELALELDVLVENNDVFAFEVTDWGYHSGLYFVLVPVADGPLYVSGSTPAKAMQAHDYTGGSEWLLRNFNACMWPDAILGNTVGPWGTFPTEYGAKPIWAEGEQENTVILVRLAIGGECSPCACDRGNGCHSGLCSDCLRVHVDQNGQMTRFCYTGWLPQQCTAAGEDYTWCGTSPSRR